MVEVHVMAHGKKETGFRGHNRSFAKLGRIYSPVLQSPDEFRAFWRTKAASFFPQLAAMITRGNDDT
jgi:hypothetical protein